MMKIVYLIAGTFRSGGMERVLANKANWLVKHGYEVAVITTDQQGREHFFDYDPKIAFYDLGINYENTNGNLLSKLLQYPFKQWKHFLRLSRSLKKLKADVVVSMFCNDASFVPMIGDGSKKVLEIHFSRFKKLQYARSGVWGMIDRWRSKKELKTVAKFDKFVVLTHEDYNNWGALKNSQVIPNACTFTCEHPSQLDSHTVIAVGRYEHQKGYDMLLKAWSLLREDLGDWQLHIYGEGGLKDEMIRQIKELSITDSVRLLPPTTEIKLAMQESSLLVLSSRYEGFGMVLLEAQTCGLPTISFDCKSGPSEIIDDGVNGYLVKEGNVEQFAQRMLDVMNDENLRMKMGALAYENSQNFSEERIMQQWDNLFKGL